ncbi:MAG: 4Fe-4S dicluster domain-containing protein [Clostridiaceae bacterium]|nr:4Fe-4S dicluster domain-containing protein [Clostridiaceae bacterium]
MAKTKGRVTFDEDRCKGCALCTRVCPVQIVVMDIKRINSKGYHPATVMDIGKCIGCVNCAAMCPDIVIRVEQEFI